jgi:hypothetical protein
MAFTSDNPILTVFDANGTTRYTTTNQLLNDASVSMLLLGKIRYLMSHEPNCENGSWSYTGDILPANLEIGSLDTYCFEKLSALGGNVDFSGNQLDQTSVDLILNTLAKLTNYSSKTIDISGGDNAAPTSASATAITKLQSQGCIITHS